MNSGVGDAIDLSWKLAATLAGWGGPNLLKSYEIERRQIGERNVGASRYATIGRRKWRAMWRPNIREDSPAGAETRKNLSAVADIEQRKSNEMIGAELGYRYVDSPIICNIPGGPEHLFREYQPTTWPGARLPHVWLDDGTPIQDRIPDGYTILKLGGTQSGRARTRSARSAARGAPVKVLDIPDRIAREIYGLRSHLAAARPARGMARQCGARRTGANRGPRDRSLARSCSQLLCRQWIYSTRNRRFGEIFSSLQTLRSVLYRKSFYLWLFANASPDEECLRGLMTSPLDQKKIKIAGPVVVTANRVD